MKKNGITEMLTIQEVLSRARMRRPQNTAEAPRSARQITMAARRQANRDLGVWQ